MVKYEIQHKICLVLLKEEKRIQENEDMNEISKRHKISVNQIDLRYIIDGGIVGIHKSTHKKRMNG